MLAARLIQTFDFSEPRLTTRLRVDNVDDFAVGPPCLSSSSSSSSPHTVEIVDLDGSVRSILHPGNASDRGESFPVPRHSFVYPVAVEMHTRPLF